MYYKCIKCIEPLHGVLEKQVMLADQTKTWINPNKKCVAFYNNNTKKMYDIKLLL